LHVIIQKKLLKRVSEKARDGYSLCHCVSGQHVNYDNLAKADPRAYEPTEIRSSLSILLATSVNNDRITLMASLGFDLC